MVLVDTILQEKFKAAADSNAILTIAKDAGFSISADDLDNAPIKLSEEELEGVAAGAASQTLKLSNHCSAIKCI